MQDENVKNTASVYAADRYLYHYCRTSALPREVAELEMLSLPLIEMHFRHIQDQHTSVVHGKCDATYPS